MKEIERGGGKKTQTKKQKGRRGRSERDRTRGVANKNVVTQK